jgi:hypothetical protein
MEYNFNQESHALRIKELETIIKICDEFKSLNSDINPFIYFRKSQALLALGKEEEGLRVLHIAQDIFEENYGSIENSYTWSKEVSELYLNILIELAKKQKNNPSKALWLYNEAYQLTKEPELRYEFKQMRQSAYTDLVNSQVPLKKFAYVEEELPTLEPQNITPLLLSEIGNIRMIGGAIRKGSFWVAHPYKKRLYYDFERANQLVFNDYINEFVQLVQHLGAVRIILEYIDNRQNEGKTDPAADKLPDDVSGEVSRTLSSKTIVHEFKPTQKAHIPTHLVWYASQPEWQAMVAERTQGSLSETNMILNSWNILGISENDLDEIQEELRELLDNGYKNAKAESSQVRQKRRVRKNHKQETSDFNLQKDWKLLECKIKVEFAPLEQLKGEVITHELDIVSMDLPEPSNANRKMASVDVSSMIQEVVEKIKPKEKEEKPVIEKVKEQKSEPISLKETREQGGEPEETAYDRWKKIIQEERKIAKEILEEQEKEKRDTEKRNWEIPHREREKIQETDPKILKDVKPHTETVEQENQEDTRDSDGLTASERYYYEMLQHAYQDGAISEDVRKVLERRRQRYKISEQRAMEIEKMMLDKK